MFTFPYMQTRMSVYSDHAYVYARKIVDDNLPNKVLVLYIPVKQTALTQTRINSTRSLFPVGSDARMLAVDILTIVV